MRYEVVRFNSALPSGKCSRRLALCGSLEDACVAALAFAKRLPTEDETVHVSSLPTKSAQHHNLGCVSFYTLKTVEAFAAECKAQLQRGLKRDKEEAKARKVMQAAVDARVAWMHKRFPVEVRSRLHNDRAFLDAWCADDFAKAEARAVELGIQPVEVQP